MTVPTSVRPGALAVLRAPRVLRLITASLLGRLPLGCAPLALILFARESRSLAAAGLLVGSYTAGVAIGGPLLARAVDRWSQPPVMWAAMAGSTVGFLLVAVSLPLPVAAAAGVLAGLGAPPFESCLRVLWRDLLPPDAVRSAYTVDIAVQELIFVVGPLVTVGAVAAAGPRAGLYTAALVQAVGTVLFATAPTARRWRGAEVHRHWAGALRSARLRLMLVAIVLVGAGVGATIVAATAYAEARATNSVAGWLLAAQAGGALIGGLAYTRVRPSTRNRLPLLAGAYAMGYLPLLLLPGTGVMVGLMVVSGLALPAVLTDTFLTVDDVAPQGTAAEAFAWVATAFSVGSAAGSAVEGLLLDATGSLLLGFLVAPLTVALAALVFALPTSTPHPSPRS